MNRNILSFRHLSAGFFALLVCATTPISLRAQNLIQNGSFELGVLTVTNYNLALGDSADAPSSTNWLEGWNFGAGNQGPDNTQISHTKGGAGWQAPSHGAQMLLFAQANKIWQAVDLIEGTTYALSFDVMRQTSNASSFTLDLYAAGDVIIQDTTPIMGDRRIWWTYDYQFTAATTGSYTFAFGQGGTQAIRLDNVSLTAVAVPEPAAFAALAGLGVLALAATRRRRA